MVRWLVRITAMSLVLGNVAWAIDTVKTVKASLPGRVVNMTAVAVELEAGARASSGGPAKEIPVNQIQTFSSKASRAT